MIDSRSGYGDTAMLKNVLNFSTRSTPYVLKQMFFQISKCGKNKPHNFRQTEIVQELTKFNEEIFFQSF
jgi:hypothetical protein